MTDPAEEIFGQTTAQALMIQTLMGVYLQDLPNGIDIAEAWRSEMTESLQAWPTSRPAKEAAIKHVNQVFDRLTKRLRAIQTQSE